MKAALILIELLTIHVMFQDMIHIADTQVARRYGDFFVRQINKFVEVRKSSTIGPFRQSLTLVIPTMYIISNTIPPSNVVGQYIYSIFIQNRIEKQLGINDGSNYLLIYFQLNKNLKKLNLERQKTV